MRLLPNKVIKKEGMYINLENPYEEITEKDILKEIELICCSEDYKEIKIDTSGEEGKLIVTIKKEKLIKFQEQAKKIRTQAVYNEKYLALREEYGDVAVKYLLGTYIDPDILTKYLPSKELIEKDYKLYSNCCKVSCGYYTTDEGLLSIELAKKLALGETLDEYPEELQYHYYWYPNENKQVCKATFTKQEFLDSIKKNHKILK